MFKSTKTIPLLTEIANRSDLTLADAVVYSALRFKLNLSLNNDKFKDQDGVYIMHQQSEIMADTGLSKRKVIDAMEKLSSEAVGLIRRVKLGRSFKIYFNEYEVEERFLVAEKAQNQSQSNETGSTPSVTPCVPNDVTEGENSVNMPVVDNNVDNLGIVSCISNPSDLIGAQNALIETMTGAQKAPKTEIGAQKAPYNKIYNNINNSSIDNNNFTLPKAPKVVIDYDLYTTFTKCFNKAPGVSVKQVINSLMARGIEKDLILAIMDEIGQKGWSWGKALDQINTLAIEGIKTTDAYYNKLLGIEEPQANIEERIGARPQYSDEFIRGLLVEQSQEWDNVDQVVFV